MRISASDAASATRKPGRAIAMAMAATFAAAAACWMVAPKTSHQTVRTANGSGKMLIPSHVPENGPQIDHAIARESRNRAVKQNGEHAAPGAALDAIYRISPRQAAHSRQRIML